MKRVLCLLAVLGCSGARAADTAPPSRMPVADAIRLDRDMAHIREANAEIARIQQAAKKYSDDAVAVLRAAKIDPQAFSHGDVTVDFETGEITRKAEKK